MANILKKDNLETAPTPNGVQVSKQEKYRWKHPGPMGEFKMVHKKSLNIDDEYQRDEASKNKVYDIARTFDWMLFEAIGVVERPDGSLWVYTGGHRARAVMLRDDIQQVPCIVFKEKSISEEAAAFYYGSIKRQQINPFFAFRAAKKAGDESALKTDIILKKYGYRPSKSGSEKHGVRAINGFWRLVCRDEIVAERVFSLCSKIADDGEQPPSAIMQALFFLDQKINAENGILDQYIIQKLQKAGMPVLLNIINREKALSGLGGERIEAMAILKHINKGKKKKYGLVG